MKKLNKSKLSILLIGLFGVSTYFFLNSNIQVRNSLNIKKFLNTKERQLVKKYLFPYLLIKQQEKIILEKDQKMDEKDKIIISTALKLELDKKKSGTDIKLKKSEHKLSSNINLTKYKLNSGFYSGFSLIYPGTGYIDFYKDDLFVLSSRGILAYGKNFYKNKESFQQIENNIEDFINSKQFDKYYRYSIKDLFIFKNKIYVSFTEEISEDCWNTSLIYGNINYKNIKFKNLFSSEECIHSTKNIDKEFEPHQSGGRVTALDDNNIVLSIGDYRSRHLAQNKNSVNGKLIVINPSSGEYRIISMGHRNPQGLYFDKENNFLLETEHGPAGGDEINLLEVKDIQDRNVGNYGWAIASAGEHYGGKELKRNIIKYEKYPLHNSHSEHGFIEPIKSFVPSIGISEIIKIGKRSYVVSSLRAKSLYFFELDDKKMIKNLNKLEIGERIRDLKFLKNNIYMFLENTASIGIIKLN